jgi:rubrerythrin
VRRSGRTVDVTDGKSAGVIRPGRHAEAELGALYSAVLDPARKTMAYYECPKCGGGYVMDVSPTNKPICDRDGARLKRTSDASYERNARRD